MPNQKAWKSLIGKWPCRCTSIGYDGSKEYGYGKRSKSVLLLRSYSICKSRWIERWKDGWRLFYSPPYIPVERWGTERCVPFIIMSSNNKLWVQDSSFPCAHIRLWAYKADPMSCPMAQLYRVTSLRARLMGPTWGPPGVDRTQVGPMGTRWTLLSSSPLWMFQKYSAITASQYFECSPFQDWTLHKAQVCCRYTLF